VLPASDRQLMTAGSAGFVPASRVIRSRCVIRSLRPLCAAFGVCCPCRASGLQMRRLAPA
jgi:hypothetical protein